MTSGWSCRVLRVALNVLADGLPVELKGRSGPGRTRCVWSQEPGASRGHCLGRARPGRARRDSWTPRDLKQQPLPLQNALPLPSLRASETWWRTQLLQNGGPCL